ncbi:MAG: hypothetical protein L6Q33_01835 [Bacteriovoracaceae bacterium]|jgi:hypothetical protein|nr:hypothetical protein [Bacteriovoracaceae bacterium]
MKNFNFKKFVLFFSFFVLVGGFVSNYFSEPSREEKVLKALNYDMRFTEKVASDLTKRKPTSENSDLKKTKASGNFSFGKNTSSEIVSMSKIHKDFSDPQKNIDLNETWSLVKDVVVLKNPKDEHTGFSLYRFKGYSFFSKSLPFLSEYKPEEQLKLAVHKQSKMIGLVTGSLSMKLKSLSEKENILREYNLNLQNSFDHIQLMIASPINEDELITTYQRLTQDERLQNCEYEIIFRFVEKR